MSSPKHTKTRPRKGDSQKPKHINPARINNGSGLETIFLPQGIEIVNGLPRMKEGYSPDLWE